ncbi:hypothetical protein DPMN_024913, partial [Dreissena polymorpha]
CYTQLGKQEGLKGPKKNATPTGGHVFQATGTSFELVQNIIGTNLLTKFHDDRTINMASNVLTRLNYSYITPGMNNFCHVTTKVNAGC